MNVQRLTRLIKIMASVPPEKLDMSVWQNRCGTAACAAGHAARDHELFRQGLSLARRWEALGDNSGLAPVFGDLAGFDALKAFFELTDEQCDHIFVGGKDVKPSDVIRYIDDVLMEAE